MADVDAYDIALNALKNVRDSVSTSARAWGLSPKVNLKMATVSIQTEINNSVAQLRGLKNLDLTTRNILNDLAARLEVFKSNLLYGRQTQPIVNAAELLSAWDTTLQNLLSEIAKQAPQVRRLPLYVELAA